MKVIAITTSKVTENEHYVLGQILDKGLPTLHVRKTRLSEEEMKKYIEAFSPEHHERIVLHSHHNLLWDYNLKGIHLSKSHRKKKFSTWLTQTIIKIKRDNLTVSTSCKSLGSVALNYAEFNYVMLTPVFTNPTGQNRPSFSQGIVQQVIRNYPGKVVARGGANIDCIEKAENIGFCGIAFHSCLWKSADAVKEYENIIARFQQLGISIE